MKIDRLGGPPPPPPIREEMQWLPHHGAKERMRHLRRICKDLLESKDPGICEARERARQVVAGKFEEYGMLMILAQAKTAADASNMPYDFVIDMVVDNLKLDKEKADANVVKTVSGERDR